ncbi:helix-turn-helix domain-containing protein [Clostridium cochlearium]|uniref:helix-turn-helix domain-containing protein n=1 Tax=Clostridium cochlearium TaxID=1494 RepID=UPI000BBCA11A|nr:helix-turn-helix transcriptional regulator [Clostridium cochlearium]
MIQVKLQNILDEKERNLNWLSKKTDISYSTLHKLANNNTTSINFNTLEKICTVLNCSISDILEIKKD